MHDDSNNVPFHARHQGEFMTLDDVTEVRRTSPTAVRWWRRSGAGPSHFDLKPALAQTRTGFAA